MRYEVKGDTLPVAVCSLQRGESLYCEAGAMSWMTDGMRMETEGGGIGKVFGRMFSGETLFRNRYTAERDGQIAFASSFPRFHRCRRAFGRPFDYCAETEFSCL